MSFILPRFRDAYPPRESLEAGGHFWRMTQSPKISFLDRRDDSPPPEGTREHIGVV